MCSTKGARIFWGSFAVVSPTATEVVAAGTTIITSTLAALSLRPFRWARPK